MKTKYYTKNLSLFKKVGLLIIISFAYANNSMAQQTYSYTQYMNNLTPYNPAYSSLDRNASVNLISHKQWTGIDGSPTTFIFTGSIPFNNINGTLGVVADQDKIGLETSTNVSAFFSKSIKLASTTFLSTAVNVGFESYSADYTQLSSQDPAFRNNINESNDEIGISLMLYDPQKFYIGFSVPRININSSSITKQEHNASPAFFSGAYLEPVNDNISLKGAALYTYYSSLPCQTDLSLTMYVKDHLGIGLSYNTSNELGGIVTFLLNNNINIGYSYQSEFSQQGLGSSVGGTHEISLGFRFGKNPPLKVL